MIQRAAQPATVLGTGVRTYKRVRKDDKKGESVRVVRYLTGKEMKQGKKVSVDYDRRALSPEQFIDNKDDAKGVSGEYAYAGKNRYITIAGLRPGPPGPASPKSATMGGAAKRTKDALGISGDVTSLTVFERTDKIGKLGSEMKGLDKNSSEYQAKKAEKDRLQDENTGNDLAVSSIGGGVQLIALVSSIQKLVTAKGGWKKASAGMDVAVETVNTGSKVADIVDKAGKHKYGAGAGFGGQAAGGAQGVEVSTMASGALSAAGDILSGIVAAIKRVKAIVDLVTKKHKVGAKEKANAVFDTLKDATSVAKSAVSATKSIVDVTQASGASEALKSAVPGLGIAINALDMIQRAFKFVVNAMDKGRARAEKKVIKAAIAAKIGATYLTKKKILAFKASRRYRKLSSKDKEMIEDYLMARELQDINRKRMTRQGIKIGLDLNDIIADALNLGGVTAAAGLSMKIVGGAAKLIMPAFRRFKQWGRNVAAKKRAATGKVGGFFSAFNDKKSTSAKTEKREALINRMFDHLVKWWNMKESTRKQKESKAAQGERVKNLFKAAGMSWTAVQSYEDAEDLANDLDDALKARE